MTSIQILLQLPPDTTEAILFLPPVKVREPKPTYDTEAEEAEERESA